MSCPVGTVHVVDGTVIVVFNPTWRSPCQDPFVKKLEKN